MRRTVVHAPPAWRLKPRASGLPDRPTLAHEATPVAFVGVAETFSPTEHGALHDGTSHPQLWMDFLGRFWECTLP
ncbi:MAG: hypothetical protein ACUVS4_14640 [Chloroflexaceae bacterium]